MTTILDLIQRETGYTFRRKASTDGGEWTGPCPFCRAGDNRFQVWPAKGRYWCRKCGKGGDSIQFVRDFKQMGFQAAKEYLETNYQMATGESDNHQPDTKTYRGAAKTEPCQAPGPEWTGPAWEFVFDCQSHLMERNTNPRARAWLHERRLTGDTLWAAGLGYNPAEMFIDREAWGLPPAVSEKGRPKRLWLPRGVTIPWVIGGDLWGVSIRRPKGEPKYCWVEGGTKALYNADALTGVLPAVLVEGEIDALTIEQEAGCFAVAVATGSTYGARHVRWLARLAASPIVLIAYDADEAGDKAADYWLHVLQSSKRWRPYWNDANRMAQDGVSLRNWIQAGLKSGG